MDGEGGNLLLDLTKALLVRVGNGVKLLRVFLDQLRINPGGEKDMVWFVSYRGGFPPDNVAQIPPKPLYIQHNAPKGSAT